MGLNTINETELINNLKNGTVTKIKLIQRQKDGWFEIYAQISWRKDGLVMLETQRKQPRAWASLDRLVRHVLLNWKYENVKIEIRLRRRKNEKEQRE